MSLIKEKILYKDWIYTWLQEKKDYIKLSTFSNYSNNIYNHIIPNLGNYYLKDLNHSIIQNFILNLFKNGRCDKTDGLSEKTIKDIIIIIKGTIKKAINENKIKYIDLNFKYPKQNIKKDIYILSTREQIRITDYVINNLNSRNIGIIICLYTGIRIGELCALKWENIDFKKSVLRIDKTIQRLYIKTYDNYITEIVESSPKTKSANRDIPINKEFLSILKKVKSKNNHYIITDSTKTLEPRAYRKYFDKILKELKITHFKFHSLRHTFATNCISLGVDYKTVSELLGHSSINTTLNLYVHPRLSEKRKCINMVCKVFKEKYN